MEAAPNADRIMHVVELALNFAVKQAVNRWIPRAAQLALGAIFVCVGLQKALDPVGFLKAVHAYGILSTPLALNATAAALPWIEILCGGLLVVGVKRRASATLLLAMLVVFTVAVALRALAIHQSIGTAFCAIRFDCGCGTGDVPICGKLVENLALIVLATFVVASSSGRQEANDTK
jgi:uncharacterized membrane protein YphA (DoxX/SURF4 family)